MIKKTQPVNFKVTAWNKWPYLSDGMILPHSMNLFTFHLISVNNNN